MFSWGPQPLVVGEEGQHGLRSGMFTKRKRSKHATKRAMVGPKWWRWWEL